MHLFKKPATIKAGLKCNKGSIKNVKMKYYILMGLILTVTLFSGCVQSGIKKTKEVEVEKSEVEKVEEQEELIKKLKEIKKPTPEIEVIEKIERPEPRAKIEQPQKPEEKEEIKSEALLEETKPEMPTKKAESEVSAPHPPEKAETKDSEVQEDPQKVKLAQPTIYLFFGSGCPHCEREKVFLKTLKQKYPNLVVKEYEVYRNPENHELLQKIAKIYGVMIRGVPTNFIGEEVIVGFKEEEIENRVRVCQEVGCFVPAAVPELLP
ncbi:MAG: hypothetical protein COX43_02450 [Parcubacteria group bacterium CG23_combo_of_CG06-09_8_20_14_all_35_9]|nr:MAG: hypothetical protein COX43_02450 [Parcubacteria group bacterium CG23_combo_of_CG06-09_8_20_14_all_35_9]